MRYLALAAAAAFSIIAPSVSHATTINITNSSFATGSQDGLLHLTAGGPFNNTTPSFGQFKLTGTNVTAGNTPVTFFTYCVDLANALFVPGTFTVEPLSLLFSPTQATNMTKLLANVASPVTADQSAAMQLAMWEIAFDASANQDVQSGGTQGDFWVTSGSSATARTLANSYLANLTTWSVPAGGNAYLLYNAQNQSQMFFAAVAVPETATWGMMIVGFGVVGATMRRRKQAYRLA